MKPDTARFRRFLKSQIDRNRRLHLAQKAKTPIEKSKSKDTKIVLYYINSMIISAIQESKYGND